MFSHLTLNKIKWRWIQG